MALSLWAAGKCARVFASPLVFGFLLNVCSSGSWVTDIDMCVVGGLHGLSLCEVITEGSRRWSRAYLMAARKELGFQDPFKGIPCLFTFPVAEIEYLTEAIPGRS